jgi:DNA-binding transcriptional LysR family regulator
VESVSILTNRGLLMETDMIGIMPFQVLKTYEDVGLLMRLPISIRTELGPIGYTIRAGGEPTPGLRYFLDILVEVGKGIGSANP